MIYTVVRDKTGMAHFYNEFYSEPEAKREQVKWQELYRKARCHVFVTIEEEKPCNSKPLSPIQAASLTASAENLSIHMKRQAQSLSRTREALDFLHNRTTL